MVIRNKKEKLYELFSQNLKWFLEHPSLSFKDSENDLEVVPEFICPLCFLAFSKKDLNSHSKNPLTLEDVPPKSLGGSVKTLTCKECNNSAGRNLDVKLKDWLNFKEFQHFYPNSKSKTRFKIDENEVNGTVKVDNNGRVIMNLDTNRSNPEHINALTKKIKPFGETRLTLQPMQKQLNEREAEIALLRIAYLEAFSLSGYGFLLNPNLSLIRDQIRDPQSKILPKVLWINYVFNDEQNGINIIREPIELRCFLIVFDIITESRKYKCAVALPGPSANGLEIYQNIENLLCRNDNKEAKITIEHIDTKDYLKKNEYTFETYKHWIHYCKI